MDTISSLMKELMLDVIFLICNVSYLYSGEDSLVLHVMDVLALLDVLLGTGGWETGQ